MRLGNICGSIFALTFAVAVAAPEADAKNRTSAAPAGHAAASRNSSGHASAVHANVRAMKVGMASRRVGGRAYAGRGGISCVPFARENSGIELSGNAFQWWNNAEGLYQRGARPEVGSVLNFRANGRMRMGHVAVVTNVVNPRSVEIDHANWAGPGASRGGVSRDITVVDVSDHNDWTAVRVALGHTSEFGSVYPTYGFIYDRPDHGTMVANNASAPAPVLNAAPRDLRPARDRFQAQEIEEVAEAVEDYRPRYRRAAPTHHARSTRTAQPAAIVKAKATTHPKRHARRL